MHIKEQLGAKEKAALANEEQYALAVCISSDAPNYSKAVNSKEKGVWIKAMEKELEQLSEMGTYSLVKLPKGRRELSCKWVLKLKRDKHGLEVKKKARLTAGGHRQVEGIDYKETFAPVSRIATIRMLLSMSATHEWITHQIDVVGAYLNGTLIEEVYMV
jgi:hypothetical protein